MKVTPLSYYLCDYCGRRMVKGRGFTDYSGINNRGYDMCSEPCLQAHIKYLESKKINTLKHKKEFIRKFYY